MTANDFRRIALGLDGVTEGAHMKHPDFRAGGKIFATLNATSTEGMVRLTPEQQERFIREHPGQFHPASGAWGRQGCTMVTLAKSTDEVIGEAMTLAWQNVARQASRDSSVRRIKARTIGRSRK